MKDMLDFEEDDDGAPDGGLPPGSDGGSRGGQGRSLVDLFPLARPQAHYSDILQKVCGSESPACLLALSRTRHPAPLLAGRHSRAGGLAVLRYRPPAQPRAWAPTLGRHLLRQQRSQAIGRPGGRAGGRPGARAALQWRPSSVATRWGRAGAERRAPSLSQRRRKHALEVRRGCLCGGPRRCALGRCAWSAPLWMPASTRTALRPDTPWIAHPRVERLLAGAGARPSVAAEAGGEGRSGARRGAMPPSPQARRPLEQVGLLHVVGVPLSGCRGSEATFGSCFVRAWKWARVRARRSPRRVHRTTAIHSPWGRRRPWSPTVWPYPVGLAQPMELQMEA